ncbi:MAG: YsnF/AvaK domain-containing protein [Pseudomonadota bacterium]
MQHTLVAVFDNRSDAQQALEDLVASGFGRQEVRLSEGDPSGDASRSLQSSTSTNADDGSIGSSIKNFFSDLFGNDRSQDAHMYSEAVNRGHHVLTLTAASEPEVERAADIVERYGPIDIDETSQQWSGGAMAGQSLSGSSTMQQSAAMSQQSLQSGAQSTQGTMQGSQQRADTTAIPVIQEELKVGKRQVERGGVRIFQRVVETPVNESVGLREEHVNVERHAVNRPVNPADLNAFQENTIELRETAEEAVVEKTARVVEEVVVGKEVTQRQQQISDTVRHTEVDVQELTADDDAYFRGHWTSNFANAGGTYDDYAPAYRYGNSMARSDLYRGRPWEDVETNLRTDWESRNAGSGSTWENMKSAVRHGWERMTS